MPGGQSYFTFFIRRHAECVELHIAKCRVQAKMYLAASSALLPLVVHKCLPGAEAVLKGVAVPQSSGCPQLQSRIVAQQCAHQQQAVQL